MARRSKVVARRPAVVTAGIGQTPFDPSDETRQLSSGTPSRDEIAMVRRATEVLGIGDVARWMQSSIPSLGNQTPYTLLKTEDGRKQVERVLLKIEHGVY